MSGLFRRLSSRRSDDPGHEEPQTAAQPGAADAPASIPADPSGPTSLLSDPAAPTPAIPGGEPAPGGWAAGPDPAAAGDAATGATPSADPAASPPAPQDAAAPNLGPATIGAAPLAHPGMVTPPAYAPAAPADYGTPMPVTDLPAGVDPDELSAVPAPTARRGKLRRRVAFLRAAREVLLRDLGGFVYELHRTAHDMEADAHRRLRETKLGRLTQVDAELHALEFQLDDVRRQVLVREPGVGGECPKCGELFSSAAHYCSHCGLPLTESAQRELERLRQPEPEFEPVIAPAAAPAPAPAPEQSTEEFSPLDPDHPSAGGTEFEWPRREAGTSWAAEPAAMSPGEGTSATPATGAEPQTAELAATGEEPRAAAAAAEAPPSEEPRADAAAAAETATLGEEPGADAEATAPAETADNDAVDEAGQATTGDEPSAEQAPAAGEPPADTAAEDAPAGDEPPADTAAEDAPAGDEPPADTAAEVQPTKGAPEARDEDESVLEQRS